jgi:HK97 gp10 family phage protein
VKVVVNQRELAALQGRLVDDLLPVGEKVAQRAAQNAPKRSGAGARSIHAEVVGDEVRVSWDRDSFYMLFHELGTSRMSARPFLRPALDARYDI